MASLPGFNTDQPSAFQAGFGSGSNDTFNAGFSGDRPWLESFARSALWEMGPGMVGVAPPFQLEQWQMDNPGSSFVSSMLGLAVPYAGWAKATTGAGRLATAISKPMERFAPLSNKANAPFKTGFAREAIRFAPLEAARVATAPVLG